MNTTVTIAREVTLRVVAERLLALADELDQINLKETGGTWKMSGRAHAWVLMQSLIDIYPAATSMRGFDPAREQEEVQRPNGRSYWCGADHIGNEWSEYLLRLTSNATGIEQSALMDEIEGRWHQMPDHDQYDQIATDAVKSAAISAMLAVGRAEERGRGDN